MTFTQSPFFSILYYFLQEITIILTIAFTSANSPLRLALLPILILIAHPIILSCSKTISRSVWAGIIGGFIISSIFLYVETALLSKWDFEAQGPTSDPSTGHSPIKHKKEKRESCYSFKGDDTIRERLKFGYAVTTNDRNVNTPWQVKGTPQYSSDPSYIPSRTSFILYRLLTITTITLIVDLLSQQESTLEENSVRFSTDKVQIFTGTGENLEPAQILFRFITVLVYWFSLAIIIEAYFNIWSVPSVLLHTKSVQEYRPNFGSVTEAYTIRQFWSVFWHQHNRKRFTAPADFLINRILHLRKHTFVTRYTHLFTVFLLSGLLHFWIELSQDFNWKESGQIQFFLTQAGGIFLEDAVQGIWRYITGEQRVKSTWGRRAIGYLWVLMFMWWSTPCWFYPGLRMNTGDENEKLLPFSLVAKLHKT